MNSETDLNNQRSILNKDSTHVDVNNSVDSISNKKTSHKRLFFLLFTLISLTIIYVVFLKPDWLLSFQSKILKITPSPTQAIIKDIRLTPVVQWKSSPFQDLLEKNCINTDKDETDFESISYDINRKVLPFVFSDSLLSKEIEIYCIYPNGNLLSAGNTDLKHTAYLQLSTNHKYGTNDNFYSNGIQIGDEYSEPAGGYNVTYFNIEKQKEQLKVAPIKVQDDIDVTFRFLHGEPCYPTEKDGTAVEIAIYKKLGKFVLLGSGMYSYKYSSEDFPLIKTYGTPANPNDDVCYDGQKYNLTNYSEFEKAFFNTFFSSYPTQKHEFNKLIDEMVRDLNSIELKPE